MAWDSYDDEGYESGPEDTTSDDNQSADEDDSGGESASDSSSSDDSSDDSGSDDSGSTDDSSDSDREPDEDEVDNFYSTVEEAAWEDIPEPIPEPVVVDAPPPKMSSFPPPEPRKPEYAPRPVGAGVIRIPPPTEISSMRGPTRKVGSKIASGLHEKPEIGRLISPTISKISTEKAPYPKNITLDPWEDSSPKTPIKSSDSDKEKSDSDVKPFSIIDARDLIVDTWRTDPSSRMFNDHLAGVAPKTAGILEAKGFDAGSIEVARTLAADERARLGHVEGFKGIGSIVTSTGHTANVQYDPRSGGKAALVIQPLGNPIGPDVPLSLIGSTAEDKGKMQEVIKESKLLDSITFGPEIPTWQMMESQSPGTGYYSSVNPWTPSGYYTVSKKKKTSKRKGDPELGRLIR